MSEGLTPRELSDFNGLSALFNAICQGGTADIVKWQMIRVQPILAKYGARLLLQIHDELVFEAPDEEIPTLSRLVKASMTSALPLDVPLKVDLGVGPNWLDIRDYDA